MTTGSLNNKQFEAMITGTFQIRYDDSAALIMHYDPQGRHEVRIQEFLDDLKEIITDI